MPKSFRHASTFLTLNVHFIYSTKRREPKLAPEIQERVHEYLGGTLWGLDAVPLQVGGVADHVHVLARLRATTSPADLIRELKKASTKWIREECGVRDFAWQDGYAAFSVSPERVPMVTRYIEHQESHHASKSFLDELEELLRFSGVEYDPKFLE